jgi:cyclopropane fatty-acyl-phospholipid synthase-like methyltransferase
MLSIGKGHIVDHRQQWNSHFSTEDYVFGTRPNAFLEREATRLAPGSSVLAVADGEGRNGVWLAEQGHRVLAVDISEIGQAKAAKLAAERGVSIDLRIADLTMWDWPTAEFDAVVAIFIQFAGPELRDTLFKRMQDAVRPGGRILLEGYRPEQISYGTGGPPHRENMYDEALLRVAFSGWDIEHLAAYDAEIEEGTGHKGLSALIDLVARKPDDD